MDIHEISGGVRENGRELPSDACADGVATEMAALTMPDGDCVFHTHTLRLRPDPPHRPRDGKTHLQAQDSGVTH